MKSKAIPIEETSETTQALPTTADRIELAHRVRRLSDSGRLSEVNDFFQTLWTFHCHPGDNDASFVSMDVNSINNYEFNIEKLPTDVFWKVYNQIGNMQVGPEEQLDILQRRYQLLEGERKFAGEKGLREIHANKEMIKKLSDENIRMRAEVAEAIHSTKTSESVDNLITLKNKYNEVKASNERKIRKLEALGARLEMEERQVSVLATDGGDVESRQIRVLENRIDKAMIKYNDALAINATYMKLHKRLSDERIGADNVLKSLEFEILKKKKEAEELVSHCHESHHAKELAQAELHRFEQCVLEERNQMDLVVAEKKLIVEQRIEMNSKMDEKKMKESKTEIKKIENSVSEISKLDEYENAFNKLAEITGVSDLNEIINKFLHQETVHVNLVAETNSQELALNESTAELGKLQAQLDELRFSGNAPPRRNANSDAVIEKLERAKTRFEKLARVMIQLNGGIGHISTKLAPVILEESSPSLVVSNETVEEILTVCEAKIAALLAMPENEEIRKADPEIRVRLIEKKSEMIDTFDIIFDRESIKKNSESFIDKRSNTKL